MHFQRGFVLFSLSPTTPAQSQTMPFLLLVHTPFSLTALNFPHPESTIDTPNIFLIEKFKTEKLNEMYHEHSYAHNLDSIVNISLYLLYHAFQSEL